MGSWPSGLKEAVWIGQGGLCKFCREFVPMEVAVGHHILPKSKGGSNTRANMEVRCRFCEKWLHQNYGKYGGNCPEDLYADAFRLALAQKHGLGNFHDDTVPVVCENDETEAVEPKERILTERPKAAVQLLSDKVLRRQTRIVCFEMMSVANSPSLSAEDKSSIIAMMDRAFRKQEAVRAVAFQPVGVAV